MLPKKILLLRFSAMGDVALLIPVLRSFHAVYPEVEVTVATRPKFTSLFNGLAQVKTFAADVDKVYTGLNGLYRLFKVLKEQKFDFVIDEHDHFRTKVLRTFFFLSGVPTETFKKGRDEKKRLTKSGVKDFQVLPHTTERYLQAFVKIGFQFTLLHGPHIFPDPTARQLVKDWLEKTNTVKKEKWVGIAPFAMHRSKIWPIENYKLLIGQLLQKEPIRFFLFGGGQKEVDFFNTLKESFPQHITIAAGVLKLDQELALMQQLDLMLCVDSSNMHFATLVGIPILSIWGGTHPQVGFGPLQRNEKSIVQISRDELPCRPCSVYGKETCARGDFACLNRITPEIVGDRIIEVLKA